MEQVIDRNSMFWSQTFTGKKYHYENPDPRSICLLDIAWQLDSIPRFGGAATFHYSVAQHSISLAKYCRANGMHNSNVFAHLMHDAPEAYTGDIKKPLKDFIREKTLSAGDDIIKGLDVSFWKSFMQLLYPGRNPESIEEYLSIQRGYYKPLDSRALVTEAEELLVHGTSQWTAYLADPLDFPEGTIVPGKREEVCNEFIDMFKEWYDLSDCKVDFDVILEGERNEVH